MMQQVILHQASCLPLDLNGSKMKSWTHIHYRTLLEGLKGFENMLGGAGMGFKEMVLFFQKATDAEMKAMKKIADAEDTKGFLKLIKKVLG